MGGFMISFLSLPTTTLFTGEASFLFHIRLSFSQLYIYNSRKTHDMLFFYIFAETFSEQVLD
jgi:hypothetical protein